MGGGRRRMTWEIEVISWLTPYIDDVTELQFNENKDALILKVDGIMTTIISIQKLLKTNTIRKVNKRWQEWEQLKTVQEQ